MLSTLPMSTPSSRTGAPTRRPPELSKYEISLIFLVKTPPVPLIRKIRTPSVMLAKTTVSPTRSCDHFNCFWLGTIVGKTTAGHHNKRHETFRTLWLIDQKAGVCETDLLPSGKP